MKLSAPIYRLKRNARRLSREQGIPLHTALDRIAAAEGFLAWSLLAAKDAAVTPAQRMFGQFRPGELVLVGARPGQGKTMLTLELAAAALTSGHRAAFFSLEYTDRDVVERMRKMGTDPAPFGTAFEVDCSDTISADHIIKQMALAPRGTLVVIDYLQLLDQRRENPDLAVQVHALKSFARERALIIVFIAQIDRTYDPALKPFPDLGDVRLPNPVDLNLFDRRCFMSKGQIQMVAPT